MAIKKMGINHTGCLFHSPISSKRSLLAAKKTNARHRETLDIATAEE
jgi:hypothetical protein